MRGRTLLLALAVFAACLGAPDRASAEWFLDLYGTPRSRPASPPMPEAPFDHFSQNYESHVSRDVRVFGEEYEYFAEMKIRALRRFSSEARPPASPAATLRVLEIGCSTVGVQSHRHLARCFASCSAAEWPHPSSTIRGIP